MEDASRSNDGRPRPESTAPHDGAPDTSVATAPAAPPGTRDTPTPPAGAMLPDRPRPVLPRPLGDGADLDTASRLGDFTMGLDAVRLLPLALVIGVIAAVIALVLLDLIGFFTNLFYYGRTEFTLVSPAQNRLGWWSVLIPIAGGLVIGLMARYGSERIRGHGIPEAMETILVGGSKVEARLAILKPISSALSIGTGGPFGAEGPIILTGGAFGSLVAQFFHFTAAERKTLLVAGAAAGMTAVFATPVASVLLAVELLLFEWKPRSFVPVAAASAIAAAVRYRFVAWGLLSGAPLFPVPAHAALNDIALVGSLVVGIAGGLVAWGLTAAVYGAEDAFKRLPIHWMWWPAIGGVVVGIGGVVDPRVLGVGYDTIHAELAGQIALTGLVTLLVVKLIVWSIALGSGTSGGILAPLLMMGAAVGGILAPVLPGGSPAVWGLVGMSAALAGVTRSPFTGVVFAFELTHDANALLPLLIACIAADLISVLALRRSILTEKVARRGFHVMREYAVDPLEALFARDVMATNLVTVTPSQSAAELAAALANGSNHRRQRLYPVVGPDRSLVGVVRGSDLTEALAAGSAATSIRDLMHPVVAVAYPDETLRSLADRMAARRVGMLPIVERRPESAQESGAAPAPILRGLVTQFDLLRARDRLLDEERHRERVLRIRLLAPFAWRPAMPHEESDTDSEAAEDDEAAAT